MKILSSKLRQELGKAPPKFFSTVVEREQSMSLEILEKVGLSVPGEWGGRITLHFKALSEPFVARRDTGWKAVTVVEQRSRARSVLLFEEHFGGRISGLLRLKRARKSGKRQVAKISQRIQGPAQEGTTQ